MNFFGHAAVAAWAPEATPAFVLGAMLPDFATISGAWSVRPAHPETARGVALHHATDLLFHAAPDFVALTRLVRERLVRGGVGRGGARAAAHVGVELLIDGTLCPRAPMRQRPISGAYVKFPASPPGSPPRSTPFMMPTLDRVEAGSGASRGAARPRRRSRPHPSPP